MGGEDWLNVNRPVKNTLVLKKVLRIEPYVCFDQLPLKIQFIKEKRTMKTLVLSREANTLPQCKSSCKEQAGFDKNLSVKPYVFKAVALNAICKAKQSTNCPCKLEIY